MGLLSPGLLLCFLQVSFTHSARLGLTGCSWSHHPWQLSLSSPFSGSSLTNGSSGVGAGVLKAKGRTTSVKGLQASEGQRCRLGSHKSGLGIVGCKSGENSQQRKTIPCLKQGGQMG